VFIVWCPRPSKSARKLATALGGKRKKPGQVIPESSTVINWGDSQCPHQCLNTPESVRRATNKRLCLEALNAAGVPVPLFATGKETVTWSGLTVVRHKLTGHSGEGIELVEKKEELPDAPLYVQYIKKEDEYRIHVGRKNEDCVVISEQRKARRLDVPVESVNWKVRNHANGFVFVRENCNPPDSVRGAALRAIAACSLDFGAVDVIYNAKEDKAYVLEINTAPGLEGQTIEDYKEYFKKLVS